MPRLPARSCCVDFQMPFFSQVPVRGKAILLKVAQTIYKMIPFVDI
jgi:hypothetical protein